MVLPDKFQRTVTLAEQMQRGRELQYVYCTITQPARIELIGAPAETRATDEWRHRYEIAGFREECS